MTYKSMYEHEILERGEATINAAKMLECIDCLDDQVLEEVYSRAKAERRERNKVPVIQSDMQALTVTYEDVRKPGDVKAMKDLALTLTREKPEVTIKHMHVYKDGAIDVTCIENGEEYVATFMQGEEDAGLPKTFNK